MDLAQAMAGGRSAEVTFPATVSSNPRFFFGSRTHCMHEAFKVATQSDRWKWWTTSPSRRGSRCCRATELKSAGSTYRMGATGRSCTGRIMTPTTIMPMDLFASMARFTLNISAQSH